MLCCATCSGSSPGRRRSLRLRTPSCRKTCAPPLPTPSAIWLTFAVRICCCMRSLLAATANVLRCLLVASEHVKKGYGIELGRTPADDRVVRQIPVTGSDDRFVLVMRPADVTSWVAENHRAGNDCKQNLSWRLSQSCGGVRGRRRLRPADEAVQRRVLVSGAEEAAAPSARQLQLPALQRGSGAEAAQARSLAAHSRSRVRSATSGAVQHRCTHSDVCFAGSSSTFRLIWSCLSRRSSSD